MEEHKAGDWFREASDAWKSFADHCSNSYKISEILHHEKSKYQDIFVFKNEFWGNILVLDGVVQCSANDEFAYQEMISHPALCSHPDPRSVLVIGGGDGGVLRELCKHKNLERIHICEIDERVIETSKKFFPAMAKGFDDKRVTVHLRDAFELIREISESPTSEKYDVIICDSTDPTGFAEQLFQEKFFANCSKCLTPRGIMATQAESFWHQLDLIKNMSSFLGNVFKTKDYAWVSSPTYPCGNIGFWVLSNDTETDHTKARKNLSEEFVQSVNYYSPQIHEASFVLPAWARRGIFG